MTIRATLRRLDVRTGQVIQSEAPQVITLNRDNSVFAQNTFFSGSIHTPQGWYEIKTQAYLQPGDTPVGSPNTRKVGIGEVFLIAGQSNAQGLSRADNTNDIVATGFGAYPNNNANPSWDGVRVQPQAISAAIVGANVSEIQQRVNQEVLNKPWPELANLASVGQNSGSLQIAPLGKSLWYWAAVGERIANQYNVPVAFFNAAWGGTTITQYSLTAANQTATPLGDPLPGSGGNARFNAGQPYSYIRNTIRYFASAYGVRAILWMQGETDNQAWYSGGRWHVEPAANNERRAVWDGNDYTNKLRTVINKTRSDLGGHVAWVVARTSWFDDRKEPIITQAQVNVIDPGNRIYPGPETDNIPHRVDRTHFNNQGLIDASNAWWVAIKDIVGTAPPMTPDNLGTQPRPIEISADGNTLLAPQGSRYTWVDEYGDVTNSNAVMSNQRGVSANGGGGLCRAIVQNTQGNVIFTQAVSMPYTLIDDTGGGNTNTCDVGQPRRVGSWNGMEVQIRQFNDRRVLVLVQPGSSTDKHYPRGDNFWDSFSKDGGADQYRGCLNGGNTGWGGMEGPAGLATPAGYRASQEADGAKFFERSTGEGDNCNFTISANTANAGCGQGVTLQATCQGNNCDNISYGWSGNGIGQGGQTISVNAPASNGTYTYTVTASRGGCGSKTTTATVNVSGCGGGSTGNGGLSAGNCYVIRSQKTNQLMQGMGDGSVQQQNANGQLNQVWKAEDVGSSRYRFTLQDGTGRVIQTPNGNYGVGLTLTPYTGNAFQQWSVQQNGNTGNYRVVTPTNSTWDLRAGGNEPVLQLWGNTGESFMDFRSFRFESAGCNGGSTPSEPPTNPGGSNPAGGTYEGFFDGIDCGGAGGWVWNSSYPNQAIVVEIVEGGTVVGTVTASTYRGDLQGAGKGNGQHGFRWALPASLKNGQSRTLGIRVQGHGYILNNSPRTVACSGGGRLAAASATGETDGGLIVWPNPGKGLVTARFTLAAGEQARLSVVDMLGLEVVGRAVVGTGGVQSEELELGRLSAGPYVVRLRGPQSGPRSTKLLLER
ncbi:hypothetical protein AWR27_03460 [Spirosoma montaniterrae]|uniref:Sialate O-acetylesterase domain-containing protein n=2 Tax=Spirosoma montaniterrae TaxID=1178516 RepID=A0A1P9WSY6_9BACT|nr:hypothetical protein AWR27_03460 [Spirosoma montaniterrae]